MPSTISRYLCIIYNISLEYEITRFYGKISLFFHFIPVDKDEKKSSQKKHNNTISPTIHRFKVVQYPDEYCMFSSMVYTHRIRIM